jgi:glycerol kinase
MESDTAAPITLMRCDGGAVRDGFLMQFQADMLDIPIELPDCTEATSRGAAFAAAVGVGMAKITDARSLFSVKKRYNPTMLPAEREKLQNAWHRAVDRAKG